MVMKRSKRGSADGSTLSECVTSALSADCRARGSHCRLIMPEFIAPNVLALAFVLALTFAGAHEILVENVESASGSEVAHGVPLALAWERSDNSCGVRGGGRGGRSSICRVADGETAAAEAKCCRNGAGRDVANGIVEANCGERATFACALGIAVLCAPIVCELNSRCSANRV